MEVVVHVTEPECRLDWRAMMGCGPDLSVIIVNWNTRDLLAGCLKAVEETLRHLSREVIVVDNASSDGSVEMLESRYPRVTVLVNAENRGFAAANNQALSLMKGRYALLLNTDATLKGDAGTRLFSFMEEHPDAAMACGQLLNADGSRQNSIAPFPDLLTLTTNLPLLEYLWPRRYPSKRYAVGGPIEVDSAIGACLIVRKKAIDEVGMLDEGYFFFFEETDWAYRMRRAGWKVYHVPEAFICHLQGQSVGRDIRSRRFFYRSRYRFLRKWHGRRFLPLALVVVLRLAVNWLLTTAANVVTLGQKKALRDRWVVYSLLLLWHARGCPEGRR